MNQEEINMANSDLVKSLVKGLNIIQLIGESENGMSLAEVAEAMDMKRPATHNLLRTLCACKFAVKGVNNKYQLGEELGRLAVKQNNIAFIEHISEILRLLSLEYPDGRIHYAEPFSSGVASVLMISPDSPGRILKPDNLTFTPYQSAFGILLLAFASKETVESFKNNYPMEEFCHLGVEKYKVLVDFAKKNKWSHYSNQGGTRIAAPIYRSGQLTGFLGIFFQNEQLSDSIVEGIAANLMKYTKLVSD